MKGNNIHLIEQLDLIKLSETELFHLPSFSYIKTKICNTAETLCIVNLPTPPPLSTSIETLNKEAHRQIKHTHTGNYFLCNKYRGNSFLLYRFCNQKMWQMYRFICSYFIIMLSATRMKFYYVLHAILFKL